MLLFFAARRQQAAEASVYGYQQSVLHIIKHVRGWNGALDLPLQRAYTPGPGQTTIIEVTFQIQIVYKKSAVCPLWL